MSANIRSQQKLAERFRSVLRTFEFEGGCAQELAENVGEEVRDLRRWADGTKMPSHVMLALLAELPRHLADRLIKPTGLRLVSQDAVEDANALIASSKASAFASGVANRFADGVYCHQDQAETRQEARRLIADLQPLAGE